MLDMNPSILDLTTDQLAAWMTEHGYPPFRARQVESWLAQRRASSFESMSNLPKRLRQELSDQFALFTTELVHSDVAPDGTTKLLLRCHDGRQIECVLMRDGIRRTLCISTQVGCGMGCVFCASGLLGVERNLTRGEILEQLLRAQSLLPADERTSHLVVMGMGESLANLDNLVSALDWICSPQGLGLSQRRVTISTVGLPEKMRKLAAIDRSYHLAVSLHAAREEVRNQLVPVNERIGLSAVMDAADNYFQISGRQVTFEYVMLSGLNDTRADVVALANLLSGRKAHVNLIPYNPVPGLPFERPSDRSIRDFVGYLRDRGISVTVRQTRGRPIDAACGQLRRRFQTMPAGQSATN
jgi:23S rRNA (adenine2503-C2)-methyltransferase